MVSGAGQAALYTGRLDVAHGVGRWMQTLMAAQPNYPQQLYSVYSRAEGLHTNPDPDDEIRYVMSRAAERDQFFFHPGIAGASWPGSTRRPGKTSGWRWPRSTCASQRGRATICSGYCVPGR